MRFAALPLALMLSASLAAQENAKPLTPAEAAKKIDEKVTVEMEVKSTGGNTARYLNSEADYRSASNFTIFIPQGALAGFKKAKIDDPGAHFKGKTIQVTGKVVIYREKPQIRVDEPAQIKILEKR